MEIQSLSRLVINMARSCPIERSLAHIFARAASYGPSVVLATKLHAFKSTYSLALACRRGGGRNGPAAASKLYSSWLAK